MNVHVNLTHYEC